MVNNLRDVIAFLLAAASLPVLAAGAFGYSWWPAGLWFLAVIIVVAAEAPEPVYHDPGMLGRVMANFDTLDCCAKRVCRDPNSRERLGDV